MPGESPSTISAKTSVRLQWAALFGGAAFLITSTWFVANYSFNIVSSLSTLANGQLALSKAQDAQAVAIKELSERFETLRQADDLHNWKVFDQEAWSSTFKLLNPDSKLPDIPKR